jgi:hypothetical protein
MTKPAGVTRILIAHFFRRFFDNDTVQVDGDTQTTVARAVAVVAVPGMMFAFFLQNRYPRRAMWDAIGDRYFFVLFSFIVLGAVSIFEWQMLFPDRLDFLVLSPLPLRPIQLLSAKAAALIAFLGVFLFGSNAFGVIMLPAVSEGNFFRQIYAQAIAVVMAGAFAALFFLAIGSVLLCVLDSARFRIASPVLQIVSTTALVLLILLYILYGSSTQALLSPPLAGAHYLPPLWFLGIYERLLLGSAAPPFANEMARYAVRATATAAAIVVLTYPLAWTRTRRMAIEGSSSRHRQAPRWVIKLLQAIVRQPSQRAVFHFIGKTIVRNSSYQVYLAMYCGTGLALALACALRLHTDHGMAHVSLSQRGLHAILPLLLFWLVAGLRTAFAFPLNLSAGWVFRVTGAVVAGCAAAARKWVLMCAAGVMSCVVIGLRIAGWDGRNLAVQVVCGVCLCVFLSDGFFSLLQSVPFSQPRMPGRTSFPLMLTLFVGLFPVFVLWVVHLEMQLERRLIRLLILCLITAVIHAALGALRRSSEEVEEEMEGYEGEFQLLGLS